MQSSTASTSVPKNAPAGFAARWLAEAIRLRRDVPAEREAEDHARRVQGDAEQRLLAWAAFIARRDGLDGAVGSWRRQATASLLILMAVALLGGLTGALTVLGDGGRPVNVIWALGSLLGVNLLLLLFWLAGFLARAPAPSLGRLWFWLSQRFQNQDAINMTRAFVSLSNQAGLTRWWLGLVSHVVWLAALLGITFGLLVALSLRSYAFSWETTILPASVFVSTVEGLGWLPGWLGFQTPDAEGIRQAGQIADSQAFLQADPERRAWASWLLGCLTVYGVLPRLLLAIVSAGRLVFGTRYLRLDANAPGWLPLRHRLMPASEVLDPAPGQLVGSRIRRRPLAPGGEYTLVAFELGGDDPALQQLPPAARELTWHHNYNVDSRDERQAVLTSLQNAPAGALLIICDAALSPDRGTLHWLATAMGFAAQSAVWLRNAENAPPERLEAWQQGLHDIGLAATDILLTPQATVAWRSEFAWRPEAAGESEVAGESEAAWKSETAGKSEKDA